MLLIGSVPAGGKPKIKTSLSVSLHFSLWLIGWENGKLYTSSSQVLITSLYSLQESMIVAFLFSPEEETGAKELKAT